MKFLGFIKEVFDYRDYFSGCVGGGGVGKLEVGCCSNWYNRWF